MERIKDTIHIKGITVVDPRSNQHEQRADFWWHNKTLLNAPPESFENVYTIEGDGLIITPGFTDVRAWLADPGFEQKEDALSGTTAAAYGGFTTILPTPATFPLLARVPDVAYYHAPLEYLSCSLKLVGAAMLPDSKVPSELYSLDPYVVAFGLGFDDLPSLDSLHRLMLYASGTGKPLFLLPHHAGLRGTGMVAETPSNTRLGVKTISALAEEVALQSIISLVRDTMCEVHIHCISTSRGIDLIRNAKLEGLPITADTSIHHLQFIDEDLEGFNTTLKLLSPLGTKQDRAALQDAFLDGTLSCVCTDHTPHEEDAKRVEFDLASYGATGLQTAFSSLIDIFGQDKMSTIVERMTYGAQSVFREIPHGTLGSQSKGDSFTIWAMNQSWTLDEITNASKAKNSPLWGKSLRGRAQYTLSNAGAIHLNLPN